MDRHSRAPKKKTSHGNEVLPQDTTYLLQRPRYQPGSLYYDPAINRTTQRPLTIVKRRKLKWYGHVSRSPGLDKTTLQGKVKGGRRQGRQEEKVGRQHQGMDRPGVRQVPEGSGEQGKMEETGSEIICGAPTTLAVKG